MLVGVASLPISIPALWNIGILHYKQDKLPKHLQHSVSVKKGMGIFWKVALVKFA